MLRERLFSLIISITSSSLLDIDTIDFLMIDAFDAAQRYSAKAVAVRAAFRCARCASDSSV